MKKTPKDRNDTVKGTIIVFHGYSDEKSLMLDKADEFEKLNYDVLLVDFMGSGGSEGNETTKLWAFLKRNRCKQPTII